MDSELDLFVNAVKEEQESILLMRDSKQHNHHRIDQELGNK